MKTRIKPSVCTEFVTRISGKCDSKALNTNGCLDIPEIMKVIEKNRCKGFGFGARSWNVEPNHAHKFAQEKMNRIKEEEDSIDLAMLGYRYHSDERLETEIDNVTPLDVLLAYEKITPYEVPEEKLGMFEGYDDIDFNFYNTLKLDKDTVDSILEDALNQDD